MNTDLLVVAATLNKYDSFLYSNVEAKAGNMIFFLSPVCKWLIDVYSNPFQLQFTYQLLDILFCFGNWSYVLVPVAIIMDNRQQFIACSNLGDITNIFTYIPEQYKENHSILKIVYELCLVTDMLIVNCIDLSIEKKLMNYDLVYEVIVLLLIVENQMKRLPWMNRMV